MGYQISSFKAAFMVLCVVSVSSLNVKVQKLLTNGVDEFASFFFESAVGKETGNFICSPLALHVSLSMAFYGAENTTKNELDHCLHLPVDTTAAKPAYQSLLNSIKDIKDVTLHLANKMFVNEKSTVSKEFNSTMEMFFQSTVQSLDFTTKLIDSAKTINSWCAKTTKNMIKDVVKPADLKNAALLLTSAVYFKGNWARKFDSKLTKPGPFNVRSTSTKQVPLMHSTSRYVTGTVDAINAQFIELPYENKHSKEHVSMYIIMPNKTTGLKEIKKNFHKVSFAELHGSEKNIALTLPKFKIRGSFDAKYILGGLGVSSAFTDDANFPKIVKGLPLKIKGVIQKAYLEVNEDGAEGSAANTVHILPVKSATGGMTTFNVDRPFIAAVVLKSNGVPIFMAHVTDPSSNDA